MNGKFNYQEQLTLSSKDNNETCTMHSKSDNIEIMIGNKIDEINHFLFSFARTSKKA